MPQCPICRQSIQERVWAHTGRQIRQDLLAAFGSGPPAEVEIADYAAYRCPQCSLEFADPLLPATSSFYEWMASFFAWYYPSERWEFNVVARRLRETGASRVLEVGCGDGHFLSLLKSDDQLTSIGVDLTPTAVETCRRHGHVAHLGTVEDLIADGTIPVGTLDGVASFHCLEHVTDPLGFVRSLQRAAADNGRLFVSVPYSPQYYERLWPDPLNRPPHHMTRWNRQSCEALARQLGMSLKLHMPRAASVRMRTRVSLGRWRRSNGNQRTLRGALLIALALPHLSIPERIHQLQREEVNGQSAADVVLLEMSNSA